jgi:succinoglycan biosynthesis transport protein ExoP
MHPPKESVVLMNLPPDRPGQNTPRTKSHSSFQSTGPGGIDALEEESLRDIVRVLRKRRGAILAGTFGVVALVYLYCAVATNIYTSTATLLVDKQGSSGVDVGSLAGLASSLTGEDDLKTELTTHATVLQNDTTTLLVIHQLGLDKVYEYRPGLFGWNHEIKAELGRPLEQAPATRERLLGIVEGKLKVTQTADTRLITVSYTDRNPQRAAEVANAYVNEYIHEYLMSHFQATARASDWLQIQLDDLKNKVNDSQQKLSDYESKTGLSVLMMGMVGGGSSSSGSGAGGGMGGGGMHIPAVDKLAALNEELTSAEADRITKEAIYQLTQTESPEVVSGLGSSGLATAGGATVITEGSGLSVLQNLRSQEAALRAQYGDYETKYGPNNPHLAELQGQMSGLNESIHDELKRINERAKNDLDLARKTEDGLRKAYNEQQVEVNKLNDDTIELEVLAGEALSTRELYDSLFTRLQEASIQAGVSATNLDLVDEARPTTVATRPNWSLYPLIGLGAGLFLGIAFAFMRENLDESIVTTDQVERIGLLPVLSYIPLIRAEDVQRGKPAEAAAGVNPLEQSLLISRPNAPAAEAYRALRTAILLSSADEPLRVLLVTSPLGGDGKSTITYNLAVAFAQHGRRVLVLDADMRKPSAHTLFHAPKAPGLSEVLTGSVQFADAMIPHDSLPNLALLPSGTTPPNPAELLDSKRFDALLEEARKQFDLVMIDSPPVLMVTDPVILSTKTDGAIIVLRSQKTTKPVLRRAVEVLGRSYGRKLGFVVNGMDTKSVEYYYTYGYYGDNKYYGEEA